MKQLLLIGGGHAHVEVLRQFATEFATETPQDTRLTLVSATSNTAYSGMLPGLVAGHYTHAQSHIALPALAKRANAQWICAQMTGLDRAARTVALDNGQTLPYDLLALDVGASPFTPAILGIRECALLAKPVDVFLEGWERIRTLAQAGEVKRITVVGGGAGGVELILAMHHALNDKPSKNQAQCGFSLITDAPRLLPAHPLRASAAVTRLFAKRGIALITGKAVAAMARVNHQTHIHTTDGSEHVTDVVIWVTGARPPAWFAQTDLTGRDGFFEIGDTLQTTRDPAIFASGDCATHATKSWPKAGVYAVKQGPILAANLRRALSSAPLQPYVPQEAALALISTGDQGAIAVRGGWTLTTPRGPLWRWKDHIDRGWMAKYQQETQ